MADPRLASTSALRDRPGMGIPRSWITPMTMTMAATTVMRTCRLRPSREPTVPENTPSGTKVTSSPRKNIQVRLMSLPGELKA